MTLVFRSYTTNDREACITAFRSNMPRYFREHELPEFEAFLDAAECPYFVVERNGNIIGCGGYGVRDDSDLADLCWGMIASEFHGGRFGEYLLFGRLKEIVKIAHVNAIRLGTSQLTDGFFQKYGFTVQARQQDGIDPGLDEVEMRLELTEESRRRIAELSQASLRA